MRISSYTLAIFALSGASLAAKTDDFVPFKKPTKDEKIPTGANYTFEWEKGGKYEGQMKMSVWKGDNIDKLEPVTGLEVTVDIKARSYEVEVPGDLDNQDATHRVKAIYVKDDKIYNFSPPFHFSQKSDGSNDSDNTSTTTGGSPTKTGDTSSTSISTSDSPGAATPVPRAPVALVGVIAIGAMVV